MLLLATVYVTLTWSTQFIDDKSQARQLSLIRLVVEQFRVAIPHDQESATVWDDAVETLSTDPIDLDWVDGNLGSWMHEYFDHDTILIFGKDDKPVYAFFDGEVQEAASAGSLAEVVMPEVKALRALMRSGDRSQVNSRVLSPGVADLGMVKGRPSIISAKPVVSDSGEISQTPGEEFVHVSVRHLDASVLEDIAKRYLLDSIAFSLVPAKPGVEVGLPLESRSHGVIGHLVWKPYRPGSEFFSAIAPVLVTAAVAFLILVASTVLILFRRAVTQERNRARIEYLAAHDALTGLKNRRSFDDELDRKLATGAAVSVLYLDLDRFKQVNDTLGHAAGDIVIRESGNRITACIGGKGSLYRIGGDEFMILFDATDLSDVEALCQRIITEICRPVVIEDKQVYIGVSIGVSFAPSDGRDRATLARKADVALYHAKEAGRCRHSLFQPDMDRIVAEKATLEQELRQALADPSCFTIRYLPTYSATDGVLSGVKAEMFWQHPRRGLVSADVFVPIAEETGLMADLGLHLLTEACKEAQAWPHLALSLRLSAEQLRQSSFSLHVAGILDRTGLRPERLELELSELAWTSDDQVSAMNIAAIRRMGVRIALCEFGAGFSSLGRLHERQVDRIKIDRRFIGGLGRTRGDEAVVRAIVSMAEANGMATTAEGVDTADQKALLAAIGCQTIEGQQAGQALTAAEIAGLSQPDSGMAKAG